MREKIIFALYIAALGLSTIHLYRKPVYAMDAVQYIGNALLMEERDVVRLHDRVYSELRQAVPKDDLQELLGTDPSRPQDQDESRRVRASDPYRYAEFLPLFAIRPLYNQTLWAVSKLGIGLIRSAILVSVLSYFVTGLLLLEWIRRYVGMRMGAAVAILLMISPPLTELGRELTSDAAASVLAFAAMYCIFEKKWMAPGFVLLLSSIYFRTDFVVLAGPVFLVCWLKGEVDFWKTLVLSLLAVGSVLTINHFAGDYGIKMLYYRNFVGVPIAPAEVAVQFTFGDYLRAFRSGLTLAANSFFIPFLLIGVLGLAGRRLREIFYVSLAYVGSHFVILPNWQERWVGVFYLCCGICAAAALGKSARGKNTTPSLA